MIATVSDATVRVLAAAFLLMSICRAEAEPCRSPEQTAKVMAQVATNWQTLSIGDISGIWPNIKRVSDDAPEWPVTYVSDYHDTELECRDLVAIAKGGGIARVNLFVSGDREELFRSADLVAAAFGQGFQATENSELRTTRRLVVERSAAGKAPVFITFELARGRRAWNMNLMIYPR